MKYFKILTIVGLFSVFISCHSSKQYFETDDWLNVQAKEYYEQYSISYNDNSTLALISSSNKDKNNPNFKLKFSVVDLGSKELLLQREVDNTTVSWFSNEEVLLVTQLGFIDKKTGVSQRRSVINVVTEEF